MKISRNKIISALIGGVIIAGAGGYALADQASRPSVAAVSSVTPSSIVSSVASQVSSVPETEVSSKMDESSTVTHAASKAPVSEPAKVNGHASDKKPSGTVSLTPGMCYCDIFDPDTGKYVGARDPGYFELQKRLGGDAGTVDPDQSTACQAAKKAYWDKWYKAHPGVSRPAN